MAGAGVTGAKGSDRLDDACEVVEVDVCRLHHRVQRRIAVQLVQHQPQFGHVLGVHRCVRVDEGHAGITFQQQRFSNRRGEGPAIDRGDDFQRVDHAQHAGWVAAVGGPEVVAVQRQRVGRRAVCARGLGCHADRLQIVQNPGLVARLFVHVLVEEVADGLQGLVARAAHAAGRRSAHRVEMPHDVEQLQQQSAVAFDRHAVGHGGDDGRVGFEAAAVLVGADHQLCEKRKHPTLQRKGPSVRAGRTP